MSTKAKIKNLILEYGSEINRDVKDYLLRNFTKIIKKLESSHLIRKKSSYYMVTTNGLDLLKRYDKVKFTELVIFDTLEMWTEADLKELNKKGNSSSTLKS
jgi:archaellum biogenesis ATPase FlaH